MGHRVACVWCPFPGAIAGTARTGWPFSKVQQLERVRGVVSSGRRASAVRPRCRPCSLKEHASGMSRSTWLVVILRIKTSLVLTGFEGAIFPPKDERYARKKGPTICREAMPCVHEPPPLPSC